MLFNILNTKKNRFNKANSLLSPFWKTEKIIEISPGISIQKISKRMVIKSYKKLFAMKNFSKKGSNKLDEKLFPVCSCCQKVRDGSNWERLDHYLQSKFNLNFTHSLCPDCLEEYYSFKKVRAS